MMKKLLSTIMAMLLLWSFAVSAHAENEFVLRNGIQFGDTKEQVRAKETIAIDEKKVKKIASGQRREMLLVLKALLFCTDLMTKTS